VDKGSTVIFRNTKDYISEGLNHLSDAHTYQLLSGDPTQHICKQITFILTEAYKNSTLLKICKTSTDLFLKENSQESTGNSSHCVMLSKQRKSICGLLATATCENLTILSERLFSVYCQNWTTRFSTKFTIGYYWCHFFIHKIPNKEGLQACHEAFISLENTNLQQPPAGVLTNLLEIVLKNNVFEFDGKCYKVQQWGVRQPPHMQTLSLAT